MDIRVADMKILDTSMNKDLIGQVITDVVLALLSYVAEGDWEERHELQRQGIEKLIKAVRRLKERDRKLLFARVFGELSFTELGEKFGMNPKQAEMAYYYIIRKLRKELEVSTRHEF